jgi:hypothetical protein
VNDLQRIDELELGAMEELLLGDEPLEELLPGVELELLDAVLGEEPLEELLPGVELELLDAVLGDEPLEELLPGVALELLTLELKGQVLLKEPPSAQWSKYPSRHISL